MTSFAEVMASLIQKHGDNKSKISRKLGLGTDGKAEFSPQLIGQYASGKSEAKPRFYKRWKEVFGDDIENLMEGNVSNETKPGTNFKHQIFEGEYVGMHKRAWDQFEETLISQRQLLSIISKTNSNLGESLKDLAKNLGKPRSNQKI
jgi:hypothetical protein